MQQQQAAPEGYYESSSSDDDERQQRQRRQRPPQRLEDDPVARRLLAEAEREFNQSDHSEQSDIEAERRGGRRPLEDEEEEPPLSPITRPGQDDDGEEMMVRVPQPRVPQPRQAVPSPKRVRPLAGAERHEEVDDADYSSSDGSDGSDGDDRENENPAEAAAEDELDRKYERLRAKWLNSGRSVGKLMLQEFDYDVMLSEDEAVRGEESGEPGCATFPQVAMRVKERLLELFELENALHNRGVNRRKLDDIYQNVGRVHNGEMAEEFNQMRQTIDTLYVSMHNSFSARRLISGHKTPSSTKDMVRTYRTDRNKKNINLKAIVFFLEAANARGLRKLKPDSKTGEVYLYEPIVIKGHTTVSYRRTGTMHEWCVRRHAIANISFTQTYSTTFRMHSLVREDLYPDVHNAIVSKTTTMTHAEKFLAHTADSRFPFYVVSDYIHGFENCYADVMTSRVYFYEDNLDQSVTRKLVSRHHHAGVRLEKEWFSKRARRAACHTDLEARTWTYVKRHLDGTESTLVYPMPEHATKDTLPPPLHIEMPAMQQVLDFQDYTGEMQLWLYAMFGRLLLPVGTRDKFDCLVLMSGETQTGKSTMINAIQESLLPNKERVAILSSNKVWLRAAGEDKFGLQTSYNKDVLICDEMERKPSWNLGEIKSMATGSWMSISIKYDDPVFLRWRAPVVLSSNYKVPEWGGGGSDVYALVRRFAPFPFPNTVTVPNHDIPGQLSGPERGPFFATCMLCYDWLIKKVCKTAFNKNAPKQLLKALDEMLCELHPLVHFLDTSGLVKFAPEEVSEAERRQVYMPFDNLKQLYEEWLKASHIKTDNKWLPEYYRAPLLKHKCVVSKIKESLVYPRSGGGGDDFGGAVMVRNIYVYGVDVAD